MDTMSLWKDLFCFRIDSVKERLEKVEEGQERTLLEVDILRRTGDLSKALDLIDGLADSTEPRAQILHLWIYSNLGKLEEFKGLLETFEFGDVDYMWRMQFHIIHNEYRIKIGQYNDAEKSLNLLIKDIPENYGCLELQVHSLLGTIYFYRGEGDLAILEFVKSLAISERIGSEHFINSAKLNIGTVYANRYDHKEASEMYSACNEYFENYVDKRYYYTLKNNLASVNMELGDYTAALENYKAAKRYFADNPYQLSKVLNNMGRLYHKMGEFDKSVQYLEEGLKLKRQINNQYSKALTLTNLGNSLQALGEKERAIKTLIEAYHLFIEGGNIFTAGNALFKLLASIDDWNDNRLHEYYQKYKEDYSQLSKTSNMMYHIYFKLSEGHYKFVNPRISVKLSSQDIFREVLNFALLPFHLRIYTRIQLVKVLLIELGAGHNPDAEWEAISEIKILVDCYRQVENKRLLHEIVELLNQLRSLGSNAELQKLGNDITLLAQDAGVDTSVNLPPLSLDVNRKILDIDESYSPPICMLIMGDMGPTPYIFDEEEFETIDGIDSVYSYLSNLAISFSVILGGGHGYNVGTYNLPAGDAIGYRAITISFILKNPHAEDERIANRCFTQIVLLIEKHVMEGLPSSLKMEMVTNDLLQEYASTDEFNLSVLKGFRQRFIEGVIQLLKSGWEK